MNFSSDEKPVKKRVVYTVITDRYDELYDHEYMHADWDYVCFSDIDLASKKNKKWKILKLSYSAMDSVRNQRWHKINAHNLLKEYDHSLYIDANIEIKNITIFEEIEKKIKQNIAISLPRHPWRDCIYDELIANVGIKKDNPDIMTKQIKKMRAEGFPEHYGLWANGIIYRKHNEPGIIKLLDDWWVMVKKYSKRDQLSFSYCLWKNKITVSDMSIGIFQDDEKGLKFWPHNDNGREYIQKLENTTLDLGSKVLNLELEVHNTQTKLIKMQNSLSWRITRPLREINKLLNEK